MCDEYAKCYHVARCRLLATLWLQAQLLKPPAQDRHRNLAAADHHILLNQHQRQLRSGWDDWTIGVEKIIVTDVYSITKTLDEPVCGPICNLSPGVFDTLSASDWNADNADLNGQRAHPQQPDPPQPQAGAGAER